MALPVKKENRYTYGDYISWPDEERWELIDGVPLDMSPAPSRRHQVILRELLGQFWSFLQDRPCEVYSAPFDVRLPKADEKDEDIQTVVQPDILVVCDRNKLDDRGCRGVPDLIIEIVSPYTASKDMKEKFSLYERHGVREYWLVYPEEKIVMVFILGENGEYGKPRTYSGQDTIEVSFLEGLTVNLVPVFRE
ncbi:MAG: Uma2 family endonuclease [bacterium]